jgi:hypothetical protein
MDRITDRHDGADRQGTGVTGGDHLFGHGARLRDYRNPAAQRQIAQKRCRERRFLGQVNAAGAIGPEHGNAGGGGLA